MQTNQNPTATVNNAQAGQRQTFAQIVSMEQFLSMKGYKMDERIGLARDPQSGATFLTARGSNIATIFRDLKGTTIQETAQKLASVNLSFGMPWEDSVDNKGRKSLPCAFEAKSTWEEIALF